MNRIRPERAIIIPLGARAASYGSDVRQINKWFRGVICEFRTTARTVGAAPKVHFGIFGFDINGNKYLIGISGQFDPEIDKTYAFIVYPGVDLSGFDLTGSLRIPLPQWWSAEIAFDADVTSLTYQVSGTYLI